MKQLNNLTQFEDFKKLYEDIGTEFSNTAKWNDSLLGRGVNSIFGLISKGINIVKLEYYKKKLENEYFAGVLRYCKEKGIDLKNPVAITDLTSHQSQPPVAATEPVVEIAKSILMIKFDVVNYLAGLTSLQTLIQTNMAQLGTPVIGTPADIMVKDFTKLKDNLIPAVIKINDTFFNLNSGSATIDTEINEIITNIRLIKRIVLESASTPYTLEYIISDAEKNKLELLKTATTVSNTVKNEIEIVLNENKSYSNDKLILEKIDNSSGTGLAFMLGDELTKVGINKFLKDQNVNSISEINFTKLSSIFTQNMKIEATNFVNKNAIMTISFAVSSIIGEKTTGSVAKSKTNLSNIWGKKVSDVSGEFSKYLITEELNPITNQAIVTGGNNLSDADKSRITEKDKEISRVAKIIQNGNTNGNGIKETFRDLGIIRFYKDSKYYGGVFKLEQVGSVKMYKYLGCLNFDTIIRDFTDNNNRLSTSDTQKYESVFLKPNSNKGGHPSFLPPAGSTIKSGKSLVGIYFKFENDITPLTSGEAKSNNVKIYYVYFDGTFSNRYTSIPNFDVYALQPNNRDLLLLDKATIKTSAPLIQMSTGYNFELNDPLKLDFKIQNERIPNKFLELGGITYA